MGPTDATGRIVAVSATDTGRTRQRNEDAVVAVTWGGSDDSGHDVLFLAVADGMGGAVAGEVASSVAIGSTERSVRQQASAAASDGNDWFTVLGEAFACAVAALRDRAKDDAELMRMGTTLTCVVLHNGRIVFAHMGDSRAYLYRSGVLRQLTTDHNVAAELVSEGRLTPAEAGAHKSRFILTRWVAPDTTEPVEPECGALAARPDDLILVCSDGLHGMVSDEEISAALGPRLRGDEEELRRMASALVAQANERGGRDNISVALGAWMTP